MGNIEYDTITRDTIRSYKQQCALQESVYLLIDLTISLSINDRPNQFLIILNETEIYSCLNKYKNIQETLQTRDKIVKQSSQAFAIDKRLTGS